MREKPDPTPKHRAISAIGIAGSVAGILDITSAFAIYGLRGITPIRILHSVASGLLGPQAFKGGLGTAALGLAMHFMIAFGAATVFYAASRKLPILTRRAVMSGLAFGVGIYLFMNLIVLPLSAAKQKYTTSGIVTQLIVHMTLIGLPIALITRSYSRSS